MTVRSVSIHSACLRGVHKSYLVGISEPLGKGVNDVRPKLGCFFNFFIQQFVKFLFFVVTIKYWMPT